MKQIDANLVIEKLLDENSKKTYENALLKAQLEESETQRKIVEEQLLQEVRKDVKDDTQ